MPRRKTKPTFNPKEPLVAQKAFTSNGRRLKPGDPYEWQRRSIDVARVRRLYEGNYIRHPDEGEVQTPESRAAAAATGAAAGAAAGTGTGGSTGDGQQPSGPPPAAPEQPSNEELDDIDDMNALRDIAKKEGAPLKASKAEQRESIRAHRAEK